MRYRLFDVDRIINRTVVYLTLSILLAAAYGATAVTLGAVLGGFSSWTAAAGTLVAAAAFRPLRRAVQDTVDRRFYRHKHDAAVRIDGFLDGLRAGTDQPEQVENLLRDVLHDPTLTVLLRLPAADRYGDVYGNPAEPDPGRPSVQLDRGGTADVLVEYAPSDDPARAPVRSAIERSRLAIEIARLDAGLNRQLAELDRSRARIASAADDERRRIQRDLHDGAQQRLVTVGMSLRAAEARLRAGGQAEEADRLDGAVADLAATIHELRDLTELPLAQLDAGIGAAFRELGERAPLPVTVAVAVDRLDRAVEATAYFVRCEGLTNVIKHAQASAAILSAVRRNGSLLVSVADNGVGGAAGEARLGPGPPGRPGGRGGRQAAGPQRRGRDPDHRGAAVRVMLVEDQVLLREGLAGLFRDAGHDVVGSLGDAARLTGLVAEHQPDVVLLDIRLPPTYTDEGTRAAAEIKAAHPATGVLLLSQHVQTAHTVDLVAQGGFGYLLKDRVLDVADFLAAVDRVASGGSALDPYVVGQLLHRHETRRGLA